jgi:hypothetical protein
MLEGCMNCQRQRDEVRPYWTDAQICAKAGHIKRDQIPKNVASLCNQPGGCCVREMEPSRRPERNHLLPNILSPRSLNRLCYLCGWRFHDARSKRLTVLLTEPQVVFMSPHFSHRGGSIGRSRPPDKRQNGALGQRGGIVNRGLRIVNCEWKPATEAVEQPAGTAAAVPDTTA